jgi:hypothetical protein
MTFMTIATAKAKFGELLTDGPVRSYLEFVDERGQRWCPDFDFWLRLRGYKTC